MLELTFTPYNPRVHVYMSLKLYFHHFASVVLLLFSECDVAIVQAVVTTLLFQFFLALSTTGLTFLLAAMVHILEMLHSVVHTDFTLVMWCSHSVYMVSSQPYRLKICNPTAICLYFLLWMPFMVDISFFGFVFYF